MSSNPSVRQFKTDMQDFTKGVAKSYQQRINWMADEVMENMRRAIEHNESGHLSQSIRKKDVSKNDSPSVLVIAGGPLTTRRTKNGSAFDYALAEEFGTVKETPKPFFYTTYRFYIQAGQQMFRETLEEAIAENNQVRALRGSNYSNAGVTVSAGHRGAIVVHK